MDGKKVRFATIDEYIATYPDEIQIILQELRATINAAAPDAIEKISYQMPTFAQNGNLVYFGAWKKHIGLYPVTSTVRKAFETELSHYENTKGTVKFPLDQPLPLDLISKMVKFRVAENLEQAKQKARKKTT